MLSCNYFFDLPVYRISQDRYNQFIENMKEKQFDRMRASVEGYEPPQRTKDIYNDYLYKKYGPWRFNEIVGHIRLHFVGNQVRGEYFSAEGKTTRLSRKRVFTYRTHKLAAEVNIRNTKEVQNSQVWKAVCEYVDRCKREVKNGRVVDDSLLQQLGPHIDWIALLQKNRG